MLDCYEIYRSSARHLSRRGISDAFYVDARNKHLKVALFKTFCYHISQDFFKGKDEATVEEWLEIADIIADPTTNKKERMVQSKAFGTYMAKRKVRFVK